MNILDFLNALENTLNELSITGRDNMDKLMGCFIAIDRLRESLRQPAESDTNKGGEMDGRQADIATAESNDSNGE